MARYRVDAIVNLSPALAWSGSVTLPEFCLPVVTLAWPECVASVWSICPDHHGVVVDAANLLHRLGARACALVGDPAHDWGSAMRFAAFRAELVWRGLGEPEAVLCEPTHAGGQAAASTLMADQGQVDAVFCAMNPVAFGVVDALRSQGRFVPATMMVVGFGDHAPAAWDAYGLTTFGPDPAMVLQHVLGLLAAMADNPGAPGTVMPVEVCLIERHSTAREP